MANNTTTSALKPCPFCGGIGRVESYNCDAEYEFSCDGCGIISIAYLSRDMAASAWNRRAGESNNAQPAAAPDLANDVRAVVQLLSEGEWADHCTKTDLGQQLEAEITRLVGAATAAAVPVVPSFDEWLVNAGRNHVPWVLREFMREGYDACRAAMLQVADGTLIGEGTKRTDELVMWIKRLAHSLRKANPDSKLQSHAMDYLSRNGLIDVGDVLR